MSSKVSKTATPKAHTHLIFLVVLLFRTGLDSLVVLDVFAETLAGRVVRASIATLDVFLVLSFGVRYQN